MSMYVTGDPFPEAVGGKAVNVCLSAAHSPQARALGAMYRAGGPYQRRYKQKQL